MNIKCFETVLRRAAHRWWWKWWWWPKQQHSNRDYKGSFWNEPKMTWWQNCVRLWNFNCYIPIIDLYFTTAYSIFYSAQFRLKELKSTAVSLHAWRLKIDNNGMQYLVWECFTTLGIISITNFCFFAKASIELTLN